MEESHGSITWGLGTWGQQLLPTFTCWVPAQRPSGVRAEACSEHVPCGQESSGLGAPASARPNTVFGGISF